MRLKCFEIERLATIVYLSVWSNAGDELFSDVYPIKERDGVFYEVTGKVKRGVDVVEP